MLVETRCEEELAKEASHSKVRKETKQTSPCGDGNQSPSEAPRTCFRDEKEVLAALCPTVSVDEFDEWDNGCRDSPSSSSSSFSLTTTTTASPCPAPVKRSLSSSEVASSLKRLLPALICNDDDNEEELRKSKGNLIHDMTTDCKEQQGNRDTQPVDEEDNCLEILPMPPRSAVLVEEDEVVEYYDEETIIEEIIIEEEVIVEDDEEEECELLGGLDSCHHVRVLIDFASVLEDNLSSSSSLDWYSLAAETDSCNSSITMIEDEEICDDDDQEDCCYYEEVVVEDC